VNGNGFMPHGYCFLWRPSLLWLHITADACTGFAYYCIPLVLVYFIRKRRDLPFPLVFWLFSAFIFFCGTTHLMSIWVLWHPDYYIEGYIKAATAAVSITTLLTLIVYVPLALELVSPAALAAQNVKLAAMVEQTETRGRVTLSAIMDHVSDGIITIDEHGAITSFNAACTRIFGYQPEEVIGRDMDLLVPQAGLAEDGDDPWHELTMGGSSGREVMARRQDGSVFPLELALSRFTVDDKTYLTGCLRDITAQKEAAAELGQLMTRLTESNAELERFAYVASHDMQEPVRMMLSFSELLAQDYAETLGVEGQEYLKIIGSSAERMRNMIHDLLDYARLDGEGQRFGPVDLRRELGLVEDNLRQLIEDTGAVIVCDELPMVQGSAVQLMRVLQNLVINAIKYQPPGQMPRLHLGGREAEGEKIFCLQDNGIGIQPGFIDEIFEPFRRLHSWDSIPGSGLGLAVCRKIVERHGGRIWAESAPGAGTRIFFTLP
jgi:PAS domain S-box-containing protein